MTGGGPPSFADARGILAILDSSVLVRAWLSSWAAPNPSRRLMLLAGIVFDSFTSPAILEEVEDVLIRPRFGASRPRVQQWLDAFVRASRQVFPQLVPGANARAVRGDLDDLPILQTAYAVLVASADYADVVERAKTDGGCYLVSENTTDFTPGWNVHGFRFVRAEEFLRILLRRGR